MTPTKPVAAVCLAVLLASCTSGHAEVATGRPGGGNVATAVQPQSSGPGAGSSGRPRPTPSASANGTPSLPAPPSHVGPLHYIVNVENTAQVIPLGYDLFDTGPDTDELAALPAGTQALVWLGSLDNHACASPSYTFPQFTAVVDRLAGDPQVYGYFIADEPHPRTCPTAVADVRARADYIHTHDPTHKSFVVVLDGTNQCGGTYGCEFAAFRPTASHVDFIGLDPYPCNVGGSTCDYSKINDTVHRAEAHGIPVSAIVPVFQAFGQACTSSPYYRLPSATELRTMLSHWAAVVPHPAFDYTYTWGHQDSSCPTLVDSASLQAVMRAHNLP